ncbi:hypothetical protein Pla175_39330 [Pirellulimonas nuda]|uniref:PQQ enzyme repeat protein n=2 Tax=Pirellulimonas nuda TaxID=2528009 RepID=A0A518DGC4_9BACT|nr:hypothetical protein Pla175_39330 [Pirellulimonas nuda]
MQPMLFAPILAALIGAAVAQQPETGQSPLAKDAARHEATIREVKTWLERMEFIPPPEEPLLKSVRSIQKGWSVTLTPQGDVWFSDVKVRLSNEKGEEFQFTGGWFSSFGCWKGRLYLAVYSPDSAGCEVVSYDIASGAEVWRRQLQQAAPGGYSGYSNRVTMWTPTRRFEHPVITVIGTESYCDYVEVLDAITGVSLGQRNFRVGFGSR